MSSTTKRCRFFHCVSCRWCNIIVATRGLVIETGTTDGGGAAVLAVFLGRSNSFSCLLGVLWKKISGCFFHVSHLGVQRSLEAGGDADGTWKIKDSSSSAGSRLVPACSNSSILMHWGIRWCNSVCLLMFNQWIKVEQFTHFQPCMTLCVGNTRILLLDAYKVTWNKGKIDKKFLGYTSFSHEI